MNAGKESEFIAKTNTLREVESAHLNFANELCHYMAVMDNFKDVNPYIGTTHGDAVTNTLTGCNPSLLSDNRVAKIALE